MRRQILRLAKAPRRTKRLLVMGYDLAAMLAALAAAFWTRLGSLEYNLPPEIVPIVAASCAVGLAMLYRMGVYHTVLRYMNVRLLTRMVPAAIVSSLALVALAYVFRTTALPRSVAFIWPSYLLLLWFVGRYVGADAIAWANDLRNGNVSRGEPIVIYGANRAGASLAEALHLGQQFRPVCFIDDDKALHGQRLARLPIHSAKSLPRIIASYGVREACMALPYASRGERLAAIETLTALNLAIKTTPSPDELVSGRFTVSDVRPVNVNDLLARAAVVPDRALIAAASQGHTILITGAGGSIGSEICRQLLLERPTKLILLDHSEYALYAISEELSHARNALGIDERPVIVAVIGSILDQSLVRDTIVDHGVDTIFHAAAYKHVPLLEGNEVIGVRNNVVGTLNLVQLAHELEISRFTMISTDKAVRPKSVMGASKRAAELVVQGYASLPGNRTRFGIVRFGNVLDSSGSVVQLFRQQIRKGGPLTVTDREVTRFFMSIPEATQLVLQASAMAEHGEVYVLDMGEPVRIYDLAANMIRLSGLTVKDETNPAGDIAIDVIGLRPGEKLYEELFVGEATLPTAHPRIRKAQEGNTPVEELLPRIDDLVLRFDRRDAAGVRQVLASLIAQDQNKTASLNGFGAGMSSETAVHAAASVRN